MAGVKDYSSTASNNTSIGGVSVAEGMLPSNINNAFRAVAADIREWFNDSQWVEYGDGDGAYTATYASGTSFTISGVDVTSIYHANRRIKITDTAATLYGTIASSSFSTNTTVNVTWDSGSLTSGALNNVYIAILSQTNNSIPENVIAADNLTSDSVTTGKITDANVTAAKLATNSVEAAKINTNAVTEAKINAGAVTTTKIGADAVTGAKIADDSIDSEHIVDGSIDTAHIGDNQVTAAKIADAAIVTNSEHSASTPDDSTFFTTSASDARYFRQDSTETISSGDTWSSDNNNIATTAAIDARVIDLVDDVGGFVAIANETSFPAANPDVNDGAGTIVSIKEISTTRTPSSGTVTIANGQGSNTVTINNCGTTVLTAGFGVLVETTTTLNTYNFHRLQPKATEVTTVAGVATEIGRLGTADAVSDMNTLGTADVVSDMNTLADITGLDTLASNSANVTTVANNISGVNSFAERYRVESSAPTTSLDVGDLYFDTTANELKVYKSSGWAAAGSSVNGTSARFKYTASGGQTTFTGADDSGNTLAYDAGYIDVYLNGVKLVNGTDVTVTSGTSVVLASGATASDIIDIVAYGTFNVAAIDASNISSGTVNDARLPTTMAGKTLTGATVTTVYNGLVAGGDGGSNDGQIQLNCSQNSHGVKIKAPPHSAAQSYTLTLPSSITNGYFLKTDGSGNLSFAEVTAGNLTTAGDTFSNYNTISSNTTITTSSTANKMLIGDISITGSAILTIDGNGSLSIV